SLALSNWQFVNKRSRKRVRHIPGRQGFVTFPLKRAECEGCSRIDALHIVRVRDQLAERVRPQKPEAGAETLLQFGLERMIGRTARVLIDRVKRVAVMRIRQQGLGHRRSASCHLCRPTWIWGFNPV